MSVRRLWALAEEIDGLKKEVKEAEARGFKNGMLHAAGIASAYSLEVKKPDGTDIVQLGKLIANEIQKEMTCE